MGSLTATPQHHPVCASHALNHRTAGHKANKAPLKLSQTMMVKWVKEFSLESSLAAPLLPAHRRRRNISTKQDYATANPNAIAVCIARRLSHLQ